MTFARTRVFPKELFLKRLVFFREAQPIFFVLSPDPLAGGAAVHFAPFSPEHLPFSSRCKQVDSCVISDIVKFFLPPFSLFFSLNRMLQPHRSRSFSHTPASPLTTIDGQGAQSKALHLFPRSIPFFLAHLLPAHPFSDGASFLLKR